MLKCILRQMRYFKILIQLLLLCPFLLPQDNWNMLNMKNLQGTPGNAQQRALTSTSKKVKLISRQSPTEVYLWHY